MGALIVFKNDIKRILNEKSYLIVVLTVTVLTILLAVYFTSKFEIKANLAVVTAQNTVKANFYNMLSKTLSSMKNPNSPIHKSINVTELSKAPEKSELVMGKYDAIITDKGDGTFKIDTFKGKAFETMIENAIKSNSSVNYTNKDTRKVGTNILGYLIMFILIEGAIFMKFFSEDKELRTFKRVLISPISMKSYLIGHCLFNFLMMYVPTFIVLIVEKEILKVNIGFSYDKYAYFLAIMTLLSTAFAFFMSSIIEYTDDVMMMSNIITTLTSVLAGSFYSFTSKNSVMDKLTALIPQKSYITLVQGIENNNALLNYIPQLSYIFVLVAAFFIVGTVVCKKRFNEGRY